MSMYGTRESMVFLNMFERRRRRGRGSGRRRRTRLSCRELAAWLAAAAPPYVFARGACPLPSLSRKIRFLTRHRRPSLAKHSPTHQHSRDRNGSGALSAIYRAHFLIRGSPMRVFTDLSMRFTSRSSLIGLMMRKLPGEGHTSVLKARIKDLALIDPERMSSRLPQFKDDKAMHSA
jgi:hypothetical protein